MRRTALIQLFAVALGLQFYSNVLSVLSPAFAVGEEGPQAPPRNCTCVDCGGEDAVCGSLWRGLGSAAGNLSEREVHIVVSHCKAPLDWIPKFTAGHDIASVHVITKCGHPIEGAPAAAEITELPNVGRCDHTYAKYVAAYLGDWVGPDATVFFLKDSMHDAETKAGGWNDFAGMLGAASSPTGFACAVVPGEKEAIGGDWHDVSMYHRTEDLRTFSYSQNSPEYHTKADYAGDGVEFKAPGASNLGEFYDRTLGPLNGKLPELVPVCYGGIFAASVSNIRRVPGAVWEAVEASLRRGDNIEEGHFMERLWGPLLATPLEPFQTAALLGRGASSYNARWWQVGMLSRKYRCRSVGPDGRTKTDCTLDQNGGEVGGSEVGGADAAQ